jgi:hypothetical protein
MQRIKKEFYKEEERRYRSAESTRDYFLRVSENILRGELKGKILELNTECPGGYGYAMWASEAIFSVLNYLMSTEPKDLLQILEGILEKLSPPSTNTQEKRYIKTVRKAISRLIRGFQQIPQLTFSDQFRNFVKKLNQLLQENQLFNSLSRFAEHMIQISKGRKIIAVSSDPSLLNEDEETGALVKELVEKQATAEGKTLEDFILNLFMNPKNFSNCLIYRDFTMADLLDLIRNNKKIRNIFLKTGLNEDLILFPKEETFNTLVSILNKIFQQYNIEIYNPLETWRYGERDWPYVVKIFPEDNPFVPQIIKGSEIKVENEKVYDLNNNPIDLSKYVMKYLGSYGGRGVKLTPTIEDIKEALETGLSFVLEMKIHEKEAPKFPHPVFITPIPIKEDEYTFRESRYYGEFTCDTRILFEVHEEDGRLSIKPLSILLRQNYPNRPDNIGAGGGIMPVIIVPDGWYEENIESFYQEYFKNLHEDLNIRTLFFWLLQHFFGKKVYEKDILLFPTPLILPESFIKRVIDNLTPIVEKIYEDIGKKPFHLAFDMYLFTNPQN